LSGYLLAPDPLLLAIGVAADLAFGDPVYAWHPVRLIGRSLARIEAVLGAWGLDGYGGGILLFAVLSILSVGTVSGLLVTARLVAPIAASLVHVFLLYSLLALGDLIRHIWRIESAIRVDDIAAARQAVTALVGRDTDRMDAAACRRAAVESLSENLTDGFVSALFWYVLGGISGLVIFKVVSTMDSMVGYKSPRYVRFGWCGARLDDFMNFVPARLTWFVIVVVAALLPNYSGRKAWTVGLEQHALLLGPNSGWSEAAAAGALQRRIVGPIWLNGVQVTDLWIGDRRDPELSTSTDVTRAIALIVMTGIVVAAAAVLAADQLDYRFASSARSSSGGLSFTSVSAASLRATTRHVRTMEVIQMAVPPSISVITTMSQSGR
jgi:adenosylcobinamide-phosphate synthase